MRKTKTREELQRWEVDGYREPLRKNGLPAKDLEVQFAGKRLLV